MSTSVTGDPPAARVDFARRQWVLRAGPVSARAAWRSVLVVALLLAGAAALGVVAIGYGKYAIAPPDVLRVLAGADTGFDRVVVLQWRMPRLAMALLVGAALGASGAIFQALTRNPLGSPDMIGINFGAYTGALIVIGGFGGSSGGGYYAVAGGALLGGLLYAAILYLLSVRDGLAGYRLIIVGIGMGAVASSVNQWIILELNLHTAVTAAVWEQGNLSGLGWDQVWPMTACLVVMAVALTALGARLPVVQMGDDAAGALGVRPERTRSLYLLIAVALVATACAAAGPISFVALAAPQIARRLTGGAGVALVPSAATGAVLLLVGDVAAQRILPNSELPVGTVTVSLGGAYLVYLLISQARRRW